MSLHWLDNADSWICPVCSFETSSPSKYEGCKCPKCGFQDNKDKSESEGKSMTKVETENEIRDNFTEIRTEEAFKVLEQESLSNKPCVTSEAYSHDKEEELVNKLRAEIDSYKEESEITE